MNLYQFQTLFLFLYTSGCTTKHHSVNFMLVTELQHALSEQQYSQTVTNIFLAFPMFIYSWGSPSKQSFNPYISTGARFSKVPIINGPGKLSPFTLKIEVSIVLHLT